MKQNKLLELLATCSKKELSALYDFAASPYFVKEAAITRLVQHLTQHPQDWSADKQRLFAIGYPNETYADKQYRYLISDAAKLVMWFLQIQVYERDEPRQMLDQMDIYSKRNLEKGYRQSLRRWSKMNYTIADIDSTPYLYPLMYQEVRYAHFTKRENRQSDKNIEELVNAYDRFYYLNRLASACDMLNEKAIFQKGYEQQLIPEWFTYLQKNNFFSDTLIESYYWLWQLMNSPEEEAYFTPFLEKIRQLPSYTDTDTINIFYLSAINYALRKLRKGNNYYREIALDIYLESIENGVLIDNGFLSSRTFGNVVKLAIRTKTPEWVEQFITEKSQLLPPAAYENALNYNLAELYYVTKNYDAAQRNLLQVEYSDLQYYLGGRILLAKIYYENDEEDPLLSLINAFNIFLKRNKEISNNIKQTCLNFCKVLYQLVRRNEKRLQTLGEEIQTLPLLAEREWLKRQYEALTA